MIPQEEQEIVIKKITNALKDHNIGIIVMRPRDGSLVLYINDTQTAAGDAFSLATNGPRGGS